MEVTAGNKNKVLVFGIVILAAGIWLSWPASKKTSPAENGHQQVEVKPPENEHKDPVIPVDPGVGPKAAAAPSNVYIGHEQFGSSRRIHTIFTTRKKSVLYQALVRYEPVDVPSDEVPGIKEILQVYGRQGRELPKMLKRIDQETEMTTENLGVPLRFITSIKLYMTPGDARAGARVVAYDMAQSTGGQPQRMVGHVSKNGMAIEVFRGGTSSDKQEVTFVRDTFIPVEYSFIHQWYEERDHHEALSKREQIKFSIFVPEAMAQVLLLVKPMDDQVIAVGDATYDCAHYEVLTVSTQSAEGLFARQEMWFDKASQVLMRRKDFDASMTDADAPVTELEPYARIEQLGRLSELPVSPPPVPFRALDYLLDTEMNYNVRARDQDIGHVRVQFSKFEEGVKEPPFMPEKVTGKPAYYSTSHVKVDTGGSLRNEIAITLYDAEWKPINYETRGEENTGVKLDYHVAARLGGEKIRVTTHRDALPELKASAAFQGANSGGDIGIHYKDDEGENAWHDPLKRVPVSDDEANAQESENAPRLLDQSWTRPMPEGIFISDYNRVEHLALLASRMPIPPTPATPEETAKIAYQKMALYLVRQNRCGVMLFEVRPEPKPRLTPRQQRRLTNDELKEPQLYIASATAAMMPCHMLLTKEGKILQLSMKYGSGDVTYTLDDAIMRHRDEAAKKKQLQEGPRLVRPPWW